MKPRHLRKIVSRSTVALSKLSLQILGVCSAPDPVCAYHCRTKIRSRWVEQSLFDNLLICTDCSALSCNPAILIAVRLQNGPKHPAIQNLTTACKQVDCLCLHCWSQVLSKLHLFCRRQEMHLR